MLMRRPPLLRTKRMDGPLPEQTEVDDSDVEYDELDRRMESVRNGTAVLAPWEERRKQLLGG
jgi:hypothetical protein